MIYSLGSTSETNENTTNPTTNPPTHQAPHTLSTIKLPILKKGLHKGYDRFQSLLSQLETHGVGVSTEDTNKKFHRSLSSSWSQVSLIMRNKPENVAFVSSENTSSTNEVNTAYVGSTSSDHNSQKEGSSSYTDDLIECISKGNQDSRRRDAGNTRYKTRDNGKRPAKQDEHKSMVTLDEEGVDWTVHVEDETEDYALMAYNSSNSGSDTEVTSCSKVCEESYAKLKNLYDEQREQLGVASIEIQAYTLALKKVEAQLVCHQKNQLAYEEKIRFMKIDLDDKTNMLIYHKKLLAEAKKEKEELKTKLETFQSSSKGLSKLLNSQMSAKDKSGLRYGSHIHDGVLSYENEVFASVFDSRSSDVEDSPVTDGFAKVEGMHAVPPPMIGNYMPPKFDFGIDESKFTYGPKQSTTSESNAKPVILILVTLILEYESDSDDEHVTITLKEQEKPNFAFVNTIEHLKNPRQIVKEHHTCSPNPKPNNRDWDGLMSKRMGLGYGFTKKACFVCGSFSHLIRDCDFHEKRMAKLIELTKQKGQNTGPREHRPVWNTVERLNHQNKFVPTAVLTKTGRFPVNAAR
nr:ribonuclease H-like domain-containing protein [Tanacetum cinerariifolium]